MKKYIIIPIALLFSTGLAAQGLYVNGGKINVGTGATLNVSGTGGNVRNETNVTNGAIKLGGTLKVTGNYTNNVASSDILATPGVASDVVFDGTTTQTLGGSTTTPFTFTNLTVNNGTGISLENDAAATGTLTLTSGLVNLGSKNLTLGLGATIAGTPSAAAMVVAGGTGELRKSLGATGSFTFPVGDNTGTSEYSPVTLNFTAGTFGTGAYAGVSLVNQAYTDPLVNTSYLNRYWNISQSGITGFTCDATFGYVPADVVGTEADIFTLRVSPPPGEFYDQVNTTLHHLTASGLSSFGTFTGAMGLRTLSLKLYLEGLYVSGGTMNQAHDASGPHFGSGVADLLNLDLHDPVTFTTVHYTVNNIELSTSGIATIPIPATYTGQYYLSVHHRNSIETVTGIPVNITGNTISYDFSTAAAKAFGNNMKEMPDGKFALYGGDANGDEVVDGFDLMDVENQVLVFGDGYILPDVNGDGVVDGADLLLVENNSLNFISIITP